MRALIFTMLAVAGLSAASATAAPAEAPACLLGEVKMFAGSLTPKGWLPCDGTVMNVAGNQALFAVIGASFGGDGRTTFALPDLRGRFPMHYGSGRGLTRRQIGQKGGSETIRLSGSNIGASAVAAASPTGASVTAIALGAQPQPAGSMPPFTALKFIICVEGVYPQRR